MATGTIEPTHAIEWRDACDRIAIRECIDRFSLAMTQADSDAIPSLFLAEGTWGSEAPFTFSIIGAERIGAAIAHNKTVFSYSVHMVHSVVIDLDGHQAKARTVLQEITRSLDGSAGMTCQGIYHDELERTEAGWRFASRRFQPICLDRTAATSLRVEAEVGRT